jgi:Ca2+-transporting ATPase
MSQERDNGPLRPRAPTITIDTSATNDTNMGESVPMGEIQDNRNNADNVSPTHMRQPSHELRNANSFDSKESRPTSPHNVSSPLANWNNGGLLSVPGARSRGNSMDSTTENGESASSGTYVTSSQGDALKGDLAPTEIPGAEEALKPDPGTVSGLLDQP